MAYYFPDDKEAMMSNCPLIPLIEVPSETEDELQRNRYSLDPLPDTAPEELRRDRLAHLLLMGFKAVKARAKERSNL